MAKGSTQSQTHPTPSVSSTRARDPLASIPPGSWAVRDLVTTIRGFPSDEQPELKAIQGEMALAEGDYGQQLDAFMRLGMERLERFLILQGFELEGLESDGEAKDILSQWRQLSFDMQPDQRGKYIPTFVTWKGEPLTQGAEGEIESLIESTKNLAHLDRDLAFEARFNRGIAAQRLLVGILNARGGR
ncbi:MAG: hypothetical protein MUC92_12170 [Fimbriimonadaceae bacterium]|nr:hypothetical protein [Fimbriimonadaceae bacterium]